MTRRYFSTGLIWILLIILCCFSDVSAQSRGTGAVVDKIWTFASPGGGWLGKPVASGDLVVFITSDDHLVCLESKTGKLRWKFNPGTGKKYTEEDMFADAGAFPAPAIAGSSIYFSSHDGSLYCVDAATGSARWKFATNSEWLSEPAVINDKVLIGTDEGDLLALDASSGAKRWSVKMPREAASVSAPAVGAGIALYSSLIGGTVLAFDLDTGRQKWKWTQTARDPDWLCHGMSARAMGYRVYVGAGGCGQMAALESLSGKLVWDAKLPSQNDNPEAFLVAASMETVVAQAEDGVIFGLNSVSGKQKWKIFPGKERWETKIAMDGSTVYVLLNDGRLEAFDEETGTRKWSLKIGDGSRSRRSPEDFTPPQYISVNNGAIYVVGRDGRLVAFGN